LFFELFVTSVVNKGRVSDNRGKRVLPFFGFVLFTEVSNFLILKQNQLFKGIIDFFD